LKRTVRLMLCLGAVASAVGLVGHSRPAAADEALERGEYLVRIMDCTGCHTPGAIAGNPDFSKFLGGSDIGFDLPGLGIFYPSNLTPDDTTGLGEWSVEDIVRAVRTGVRPDGRGLAPIMPWQSFANLTDEDAHALAAYLKSLPPVQHKVPDPVGGPEAAEAPYLAVITPK
jgi:mono/diheme cytochrome c family protein